MNSADGHQPLAFVRKLPRWLLPATGIGLVALVMVVYLALKPNALPDAGLTQSDDYPLYTMHYYGDYNCISAGASGNTGANRSAWGCTLFSAFSNDDRALGGRNFDWQFSPALLLFTHPRDGYASVSMVPAQYMGFTKDALASASASDDRFDSAPYLPFDGMNEHGLYVGMAAVPDSPVQQDSAKPTIDSLCAIREMLDHARNVEEAIQVIGQYNVNFAGGPQIHYLIADRSGHSAVIEYKDGAMHVLRSEQPWQTATNFYLQDSTDADEKACWRYTRVEQALTQTRGVVSADQALDLLRQSAQDSTQWSVVYDLLSGDITVAMGRHYDRAHKFNLPMQK